MFYFCAQTGVISDTLPSFSNYYHFALKDTHRKMVEEAVEKATIDSCGLSYEKGFLDTLSSLDQTR